MRRLSLGSSWFGGVRLSAKAVVIGAVALTFGTAQVAQAGTNVWTSHGPYGGNVLALAINPTTPSTLYAGMGGGVFSIQQVSVCVGDCNGNGQVTVDEILTLVNIALGKAQLSDCGAGDANNDGQITVDEILTAVNNALNGCAGG